MALVKAGMERRFKEKLFNVCLSIGFVKMAVLRELIRQKLSMQLLTF